MSRRTAFGIIGGLWGAPLALVAPGRVAATGGTPWESASARGTDAFPPIVQPATPDRGAFMRRALDMQRLGRDRGDQPYGAVIVKDGRIVSEQPSAVITRGDPTAHAEIEAIRDAARRLGTRSLSGCEMYGSARACAMCEAAAYWAGIAKLFHGASVIDTGPLRYAAC